jgi:hypothetical protein
MRRAEFALSSSFTSRFHFVAEAACCRWLPRRFYSWLARVLMAAGLLATWVAASANASGIYWTAPVTDTIGRSDLDGTNVNESFITTDQASGLAVDETFIYWTNASGIGRANLDGTNVSEAFISGVDPATIAVDDGFIYWVDYNAGTIGRANLDGTNVNQTFISGTQDGSCCIAVDEAHLYWASNSSSTISRANLDGTGVEHSFLPAGAAIAPFGIAVDGSFIYWAVWNGFSYDGIGRANLDGTGLDNNFIDHTEVVGPYDVEVDGAFIYWTNNNGTIGRANLDGTGVIPSLISGIAGPVSIAVVPVPEPATGSLLLAGLAGMAALRSRAGFGWRRTQR